MFKNLSLQERFYVGYIYLILLGVVNDAFFYGMIGVSYLNYVTILDALVSPINLVTDNWRLPLTLILVCVFIYFYLTKLMPLFHKKNKDKKWYKKISNEKADEVYDSLEKKKNIIGVLMVYFFIFFVSISIGRGASLKNKIKDKKLKENMSLIFKDGSKSDVIRIGQNSSYIFYIENGETQITITPLSENIKKIKRIPQAE